MKIKIPKGCAALPTDIEKLEREIDNALPAPFLAFILEYDGVEPERNIFKIASTNDSGVNGFIPVREIPAERGNIESLPPTAFPFAWAEGGNYVFIDVASGAVFFWDHEQPNPPVKLAPDFKAFLDLLEAFDPNSIKLNPSQVKTAWIDPGFLKESRPVALEVISVPPIKRQES